MKRSLISICCFAFVPTLLAQNGIWSYKATDPNYQDGGLVGAIGEKLYVAGGSDLSGHRGNLLTVYDPSIDTWVTKTSMPTERVALGGGVVNGKLYAAGGHPDSGIDTDALEAYDPTTDSWSTLAPIPIAVSYAASAVYGQKLYIIGGAYASFAGLLTNALQIYDPQTNTWTSGSPMPTVRYGPAADVIDGKIYVVGGGVDLATDAGALGTLEVYDVATDTWTTRSPMPTAREYPSVAAINGLLYAAGGYSAPNYFSVTEVYNSSTDTWVNGTTMPSPSVFLGGPAVIDGSMYLVGRIPIDAAQDVLTFTPRPIYQICLLDDSTKAVKSGATIPIKLELCDSSADDLSSSTITLHATSVTQISTSISGSVQDAGNANPDNDFRFDSTLGVMGGYIFNLKTTGMATGTYSLNFTVTGDSSIYGAPFQVK